MGLIERYCASTMSEIEITRFQQWITRYLQMTMPPQYHHHHHHIFIDGPNVGRRGQNYPGGRFRVSQIAQVLSDLRQRGFRQLSVILPASYTSYEFPGTRHMSHILLFTCHYIIHMYIQIFRYIFRNIPIYSNIFRDSNIYFQISRYPYQIFRFIHIHICIYSNMFIFRYSDIERIIDFLTRYS